MAEIVSFGEWVQKRRNQLGYSRTVLAKQIGCAPITIKKIERDERRPSEEMAELFSQHLQIPEDSKEVFMRRARGEFVSRFSNPEEMSLAEAKALSKEAEKPKHNLPVQTTSFFGRKSELTEIGERFADPSCKLLTILGAGGMGKTRLAVEAATEQINNFTDGVVYVSLAPVEMAHSDQLINPLVGALADALKISFHAEGTPEEQMLSYLSRKETLLVFDNFEHLIETADYVADLLRAAPDIKILVTSRTRLHLQEEWVLSLHGLQYPQTENEDAETFDAVTLFMQRARQLKSDFDLESEKAHILRICQLVEGMPLGLELAAAWVRQIPCETIAQEIESEIDFLSTNLRNLPDRHRSIRAVFAYSWQKLDSREQAVLKKLSVFRGGFERDAAKAVAGASLLLLSGLVDKSLLSVTKSGRYMIHELLRQFAAEKLSDSSDSFETQGLHSRFYFTFLEKQERPIKGPQGRAAVKAIEREIDNIRNSIHWALDHNRQLFTMSAGFTLSLFFEIQGWFREGEVTFHLIANALKVDCENALPEELPSSSISPITLHWAQCNVHWGRFQWRLGELNQADETLQNSLSHLPPENLSARWTRGYAFWILGAVAAYRMDFTRSISLIKKGRQLFKDAGDLWGYAGTLMFLGQVMHNAGDYDEAQLVLEMTAGILEQLGEQYMTGFNLSDRGRVAAHFGELAQAETYHQAALAQRMKLGTRTGIAISLRDLGNISRLRGKYEEAQSYYQQSLILAQDANMPYSIQDSVFQLGNLAVAKGNFAEAKRHFQESSTLLRYGDASGGIGWAALGLGELEEAKGQFLTALQKMVEGGSKPVGLDSLVGIAHLLAQTGNLSRALELLTLVNRHSASNYEIKEKVRMLWEELVAELSPELIAEAEARGRELDLFETAENLLAEESNI